MGLAVGVWTTVARRTARVAITTTNLGQLALIICPCREVRAAIAARPPGRPSNNNAGVSVSANGRDGSPPGVAAVEGRPVATAISRIAVAVAAIAVRRIRRQATER